MHVHACACACMCMQIDFMHETIPRGARVLIIEGGTGLVLQTLQTRGGEKGKALVATWLLRTVRKVGIYIYTCIYTCIYIRAYIRARLHIYVRQPYTCMRLLVATTSTTVLQRLSPDEAKEWGNFTMHAPGQVWLAMFSDGKVAPPADVDDRKAYFASFDEALHVATQLAYHGALAATATA